MPTKERRYGASWRWTRKTSCGAAVALQWLVPADRVHEARAALQLVPRRERGPEDRAVQCQKPSDSTVFPYCRAASAASETRRR